MKEIDLKEIEKRLASATPKECASLVKKAVKIKLKKNIKS